MRGLIAAGACLLILAVVLVVAAKGNVAGETPGRCPAAPPDHKAIDSMPRAGLAHGERSAPISGVPGRCGGRGER